ncbi:N-acetylgalactosamine kinase, partial [Fasciolopsis buskii]
GNFSVSLLLPQILVKDAPKASEIDCTRPISLAEAQRAWQLLRPGDMVKPTGDKNQSIVSARLHPGLYKLSDLIDLGMTKAEVQFHLTTTTKSMTEFKLRERAEHVYAEAERVYSFYDLCCQSHLGGDVTKDDRLSEQLATLMNASQQSCAELYECSCPELDQLVKISKASGAIGSRLTGAGWGGCTVSMVPKMLSEKFIESVCREYYEPRGIKNASESLIFVSQPGHPAGLMFLQ